MCDQYSVLCVVNTLWWCCEYPVLGGWSVLCVAGVVNTLCSVVNTLSYVRYVWYFVLGVVSILCYVVNALCEVWSITWDKCDQHVILGWANTLRLWGQPHVLYVVNTLCQVWSKSCVRCSQNSV